MRTHLSWAAAASAAVIAGTVAAVAPAEAAPAPTITVSAPQYDSPGAIVPVMVTINHVPQGATAALTRVTASNGASVSCSAVKWTNPVRRSYSQKCYVKLPTKAGSHAIRATGTIRAGGRTTTVSGTSTRNVLANGVPSPTPMTFTRMYQIEKCQNTSKNVWLTFDDGGSATQVRSILATLKRNNAKGRFFFTGAWAAKNPTLMKEIRSQGHVLANHSYSHPALSKSSNASVTAEIRRGVQGTSKPKLLRPPYAAGAYSTRLDSLARAQGHQLCRWTTDTYDWNGSSAAVLAERVRYGDALTPPVQAGGVILMHGTGRNTATGLQGIIDAVKARGLRLEPLR
jgi:peptidoglycan/xylan/chitin deacetylase (PgdA/CDA1 family)